MQVKWRNTRQICCFLYYKAIRIRGLLHNFLQRSRWILIACVIVQLLLKSYYSVLLFYFGPIWAIEQLSFSYCYLIGAEDSRVIRTPTRKTSEQLIVHNERQLTLEFVRRGDGASTNQPKSWDFLYGWAVDSWYSDNQLTCACFWWTIMMAPQRSNETLLQNVHHRDLFTMYITVIDAGHWRSYQYPLTSQSLLQYMRSLTSLILPSRRWQARPRNFATARPNCQR
jgi:hypothetical protein